MVDAHHRAAPVRRARRGAAALAALALVGVGGAALVALAGRGPAGVALLVKPASVEYIKQQTKRVEQMNAKLAREDTLLAKEEKAEEMRVVAVRKAHQLAQERARATPRGAAHALSKNWL